MELFLMAVLVESVEVELLFQEFQHLFDGYLIWSDDHEVKMELCLEVLEMELC